MSEENIYAAPKEDVQNASVIGGPPGPHNYAGLGERLVGAIIDVVILIPVAVVLGFIFGMVFTPVVNEEAGFLETLQEGAGFGIVGDLLFSLVAIAIYIAIQWTFWKGTSQSIGKKVMKTQIVNLDGSPADVKTIAFNRYGIMAAISAIPVAGQFIALVDALLVFRGERNCLHDDIAKTRVIKLAPPQA